MCRNYDAGECVEDGCAGRITCHDFTDQRCAEHSYNGRNSPFLADDDEDWVTDEAMSREETLARFEALNPDPSSDEIRRRELAYGHRGEVVPNSGVPVKPRDFQQKEGK